MKVSIFGTGLTGLVTGWALADVGNEVMLVSCEGESASAVAALDLDVREPGLEEGLREQRARGRLTLSRDLQAGFAFADVHFIALGADAEVEAKGLLKQLAEAENRVLTVVNQSTFPVGAAGRLREAMLVARERQGNPEEVHFLALPSFLQEGAAIKTFTRPKRILLGSDEEWGLRLVRELLRPFCRNQGQLMIMSTREAEFTKYAINGMLATKLSFMNEMANLADQLQVDIEQVRKGVGSDPRIGYDYIYPGCGFGGQAFSQDVMQLARTLEAEVEDSFLLQTVLATNEQQKEVLFRKLWRYYEADLEGRVFALWGAAFKPGTDRIDNAPSLALIEALRAQGARVRVYDPRANGVLARHFSAGGQAGAGLGAGAPKASTAADDAQLVFCEDPYQAAQGADALLLVTEWKEFWSPDFERLRTLLKAPLIFDGRNIYDPEFMRSLGFRYSGVGRSSEFVQHGMTLDD